MAAVAMFDARDIPLDAYDEILAAGGPEIANQPERLHHVCYESGSGFGEVDIWETEAALARFGEHVLGPAMAEFEPGLVDDHAIPWLRPGGARITPPPSSGRFKR